MKYTAISDEFPDANREKRQPTTTFNAISTVVGAVVLVFLAMFLGLALGLVNAFTYGYVAYKLYGFFILPFFESAPILPYIAWVCILCFKNFLFHSTETKYKDHEEKILGPFVMSILYPFFVMIGAWIFIHVANYFLRANLIFSW